MNNINVYILQNVLKTKTFISTCPLDVPYIGKYGK